MLEIKMEKLGILIGREENLLVFNEEDETTQFEQTENNSDPTKLLQNNARMRSGSRERKGKIGWTEVWDCRDQLPITHSPSSAPA